LAEIIANIDAETAGIVATKAFGVDISLVKRKRVVIRKKQITHLSRNYQLLVEKLPVDAQI
jgi:hypothetical protein